MANQQLNAKLVTCNIPTKNSEAARKFYNLLFGGQDFARSLNDKRECYFRPIHQDGLTLSIAKRADDREPITCFFAVDNLDETVRQLVSAGGKVILNSTEMPVSGPPQATKTFNDARTAKHVRPSETLGHFVTMLDPDGNYLGLMQLDDSMLDHFNARPEQRKLSKDQVDEIDNWKLHGEPSIR